jgi:hypothetical protein
MRVYDRHLIGGGHYGQRSNEPQSRIGFRASDPGDYCAGHRHGNRCFLRMLTKALLQQERLHS